MTLPTKTECGFLAILAEPYCAIKRMALPGDVARRMHRQGWLEWNGPVSFEPFSNWSITEEGRQALAAAKALEGGR